jgi:hypothetical protein
LLAIFAFLFICYPECDGREKGGDIRAPISLVSECKVRDFYGFGGDKEGREPAIESLGTDAPLLIHN